MVSPEIDSLSAKFMCWCQFIVKNFCEISLTPLNTICSHAKVTGGPALTLGPTLQL